jgi:hypothetical protein
MAHSIPFRSHSGPAHHLNLFDFAFDPRIRPIMKNSPQLRRCNMRRHRSVLLIVTGSFLLGLVGCAGDSMKSSQRAAEAMSTSTVAQGKATQGEPPSE